MIAISIRIIQIPILICYYVIIQENMRKLFYRISDRQWLYQTCTEFGFFQTSTQDHHLFGNTVSLEYFTDLCADVFGKS